MPKRNNSVTNKEVRKNVVRLTDSELTMIQGIREQSEKMGIGIEHIPDGWLKSKEASFRFKNPLFKEKDVRMIDELAKQIVEDVKKHAPEYKTIKRKKDTESCCLILDPADVHIGKLADSFETGEDYNSEIAVQRVHEGIEGIIHQSSGWNKDQIVLVGGNDILHIDTPKRTTTSGTPQDTSGMWYDNFLKAKKLYVDIIEMLIPIADVHFVFNPSNHDYTNGFFLADLIQTWFRNSKNVTFDCSISHRKYFQYHKNLIGTSHGDGAKTQDLPLLMAQEAPKMWSDTVHRYFYIHHFHHKQSKDYAGVTVESLRSPSGADSWHHRNGFQHAPKAIEGFIHHKHNGQIARLTHIF